MISCRRRLSFSWSNMTRATLSAIGLSNLRLPMPYFFCASSGVSICSSGGACWPERA